MNSVEQRAAHAAYMRQYRANNRDPSADGRMEKAVKTRQYVASLKLTPEKLERFRAKRRLYNARYALKKKSRMAA